MLGTTQRDRITGCQGVITGLCTYLTGCNQALMQPPANEKGEYVESRWYDVQRLEQVGTDTVVLDNGPTPGFDKPAPRR